MLLSLAPIDKAALFEPLTATDVLLGNTVLLIMGGLVGLALFGLPLLRALATLIGGTRWLGRELTRVWIGSTTLAEPVRALELAGLSPGLSKLARQTRTLALELRRRSEAARHWPEDVGELELVRPSFWSSLGGEALDFRPLFDTRREVFDWLGSVEELGTRDREALDELGVDIEAVREALTHTGTPVAERIRALAGLLWSIDDRFAGATSTGYRANAAEGGYRDCNLAPREDDDELELGSRRRFAELFGAERRGLSRMAGSYARSEAEREDLEQDIALALWSSLPKFRGEAKLETFAYRVARYCCYRHARRRGRLPSDAEAVAELHDAENLEQRLLDADDHASLQRALAELPETLGAAMSLHLEGLSYAEIGSRLGITEQNVSARLSRARARLAVAVA